jgi:hypothetical protein
MVEYYSTDFGCNFKLGQNGNLMINDCDVWKYVNIDEFDMPDIFILNTIIQTLNENSNDEPAN